MSKFYYKCDKCRAYEEESSAAYLNGISGNICAIDGMPVESFQHIAFSVRDYNQGRKFVSVPCGGTFYRNEKQWYKDSDYPAANSTIPQAEWEMKTAVEKQLYIKAWKEQQERRAFAKRNGEPWNEHWHLEKPPRSTYW